MNQNQVQKIRDDTSTKTQTAVQSPDILLLANTKTKSIRVAGDEAGKTDRFDKINHDNPPFLIIDKNTMMENFLSNYFRQSKDPTEFRFFIAPLLDVKDAAPFMRDLFREKPSKEIQDFADKYEVIPVSQAQKKESNQNQSNQNQTLKENQMSTDQNTQTQTQSAPLADNASKQRFTESMINWEQLSRFGISRDILQRKGALDDMLAGRKTNTLFPLKVNLGTVLLDIQAKLSLRQTPEGPLAVAIHGVKNQPELKQPFYGHIFSEEDQKNLKETGHMGRLANLSYRGSEEKVPCYISLDPLTNEILAANAQKVNIPEKICGVVLSENELNELKAGRRIHVEGMVSPKTGKEFNADLQVSAEKYGLQFYFEKGLVTSLGNVELTKQQVEDYNSGKTIFLKDMKRRNGDEFTSFITKDVNGNPSFTRYNPQSPEGAREIYIPNVINGVEATKDEMKALRRGAPIFLNNMVNNKGEEFSAFVKVDTESGKIMYSDKENGFNERPEFKIPPEVFGHKFTREERQLLQDGKTIHVTGMKGFDRELFSSYLTANHRMGHFDFTKEHPDNPKKTEGQTTSQTAAPESKQQTESPKSTARQSAKEEAKKQTVKETGKQDKAKGFTKKVKV